MLPLSADEQAELVDTCGTGGDASGSFNISTAAALVAAAAGAKVAKHGNRAVTSRCGSADVLEALGVPVTLAPDDAAKALREHGFCFLLAPSHHPAMKSCDAGARRALGVRTVLHVLGPLLNPAGARRQVMGVYAPRLVPVVAEAMTLLGAKHSMVVCGENSMDELSLSRASHVAEVRDGSVREYVVMPEEFGLQRAPLSALRRRRRRTRECGDPGEHLCGRAGSAARCRRAQCRGGAGHGWPREETSAKASL